MTHLLRTRNASDKDGRENQNTHFVFSIFVLNIIGKLYFKLR